MRFQDDGGTPAWRARQAAMRAEIIANRPLPWWAYRRRWKRLGLFQQLSLILGCLVAPWLLLIVLLIFWGLCGC